MLVYIVAVVLAILIGSLMLMVASIDDWSRDLTTNVAETSSDALDLEMRPLKISASVERIADAAKSVADSNADWEFIETNFDQQSSKIEMVHVTRLMKYRDDVTLMVEPVGNGTALIHFRSASRIGKGDLGQNPRNIRTLRGLLIGELADEN